MRDQGARNSTSVAVIALAILGLTSISCNEAAYPAWTLAAEPQHTVVWSFAGRSDEGGATFTRASDRRVKPGAAFARVSCDIESVLYLALVNGALERGDQPVPLEPSGKLVCSRFSASHLVTLTGQATGGEDRVLVRTRAGATGRDVVTYSIDILQPLDVGHEAAGE